MATTTGTEEPTFEDKKSLDDEIDKLLTGFKGQCKILEGTGRFKKIVKLNPEGQNIVFNFKFLGNFYYVCYSKFNSSYGIQF